jgi:hypothetical protein
MSDDTPLANQMSINLALFLDDAVQGLDNGLAARCDGQVFSWRKRGTYLNEGARWIVTELVNRFGVRKVSDTVCRGAVKFQPITFVVGGVALNGDFMYSSILLSGTTVFKETTYLSLVNDLDSHLDAGFAIQGGKIYTYKRTAGVWGEVTSGTGTLFYLGADRVDSTGADVLINSTPDFQIEKTWHDAITLYAAGRAWLDKSNVENDQMEQAKLRARGMFFIKQASEKIPSA